LKEIIVQKGKSAIDVAVKVCNVLASLSVVSGMVLFVFSQYDRELQTATSAWSAISDPKPGISVARELEFLSTDTLFRTKSSFDNVHLVPEDGKRGVSLKGLTLRDASLQSVTADRAELSGASISNSDMTDISLKNADITETVISDSVLVKADLSNAFIIKSQIDAVLGGASIEKSLLIETAIETKLPVVHVLNRETLLYDKIGRLRASRSFMRSSSIVIDVLENDDQCGVIEFDATELYYSTVTANVTSAETRDCFLLMDKGWLVGSTISGKIGMSCEGCTIGYSDISIGSNFVAEETRKEGVWSFKINVTTFKDVWAFKSKISGAADGVDFSNARFEKVDMRDLDPAGANISGAHFDDYDRSVNQGADTPDRLLQIFYRGYGQSLRNLEISEGQFDEDVATEETPEQVLERYPQDGFSKAWAWADRPPVGIPNGIAGPVLCDPKLKLEPEAMNEGTMPEACGKAP
jgi:uncharacterized protein YjbI with pentapeptide repeats